MVSVASTVSCRSRFCCRSASRAIRATVALRVARCAATNAVSARAIRRRITAVIIAVQPVWTSRVTAWARASVEFPAACAPVAYAATTSSPAGMDSRAGAVA